MAEVESLSIEILKQIRADLKEGLSALRQEVGKTNEGLSALRQEVGKTNERLDDLKEMQDVLTNEHRKTNQRLDFFAEELVRMRTRDITRIDALESAVAELQRKVG
jgi:chromosome segregation ATPase